MLYNKTIDANHTHCGYMQEAVETSLDRAVKNYGEEAVDRCGVVNLQYYNRGKNAAIAAFYETKDGEQNSIIQFSMELVTIELRDMINHVVPHEVAHLLCFANDWDRGHGGIWRNVCFSLGGDGRTHHSMKVTDGRARLIM